MYVDFFQCMTIYLHLKCPKKLQYAHLSYFCLVRVSVNFLFFFN